MRGVSVFAVLALACGLGGLPGCKSKKAKKEDPAAPAAKDTGAKPAPKPQSKAAVPTARSISGGGRVTGGGMTLDVQIGGGVGMPPPPKAPAKAAPATKPPPAKPGKAAPANDPALKSPGAKPAPAKKN